MKSLWIIALLSLSLIGCGVTHDGYHLILVEKERHFYDLKTLNTCEVSGYDVVPKDKEEHDKPNVVELWITYENCSVKEKVVLDDEGKVMWGVPMAKPVTQQFKQKEAAHD